MAIKLISRDWCADGSLAYQYILDSASDVADLPECPTGSVAVVADKDGAMYMVNASGEWKEQKHKGGGSGGGEQEDLSEELAEQDELINQILEVLK